MRGVKKMYLDENEEYKSKYFDLLAHVEELKEKQENSEPTKGKKKPEPIQHRLVTLDESLEKLFVDKVDFKNRLIMARDIANELKIKISSEELRLRVWDARKRIEGNTSISSTNDIIESPPHVW